MSKKEQKSKKEKSQLDDDLKKERPAIIAELSFIFLPFIVILIINLSKGDWSKLIQTADWALASTILFGQTIVKIIMGLASREQSFNYQNFGLVSSLIIILGLIPSILIISIFELNQNISTALIVIQFILLGLAIYVFLLFGTIGQHLYTNSFRYKISKVLGLDKSEKDETTTNDTSLLNKK